MSDTEMIDAPSPSQNSKTIIVSKPIPYNFDLGHLLVNDENPLPTQISEDIIQGIARDCVQGLVNQILTTCEIKIQPSGTEIILPQAITPLPREKSLPKPKEATKWEKFAAKKGIRQKKKENNKVYDEQTGEWVSKYGFKGANKKGENDWLVEINDKSQTNDPRAEKRQERKERIKRQERKMRSNETRKL